MWLKYVNVSMKMKLVFSLGLVLLLNGCVQNADDFTTPKLVLEKYIEISFNARSLEDRALMLKYLTGDTKKRLAAWSNDQFLQAFVESDRKFKRLKILETKRTNDETLITYELSFDEHSNEAGTTRVTQKKLCMIVQEDSDWKIKEVKSVRESIEYVDGLSLP